MNVNKIKIGDKEYNIYTTDEIEEMLKSNGAPFKSAGWLIPENITSYKLEDINVPNIDYVEPKTPPEAPLQEGEMDIWSEGYSATGEHHSATYHGRVSASSLLEGVLALGLPVDRDDNGPVLSRDGHPMCWFIRYFDNETDARKSCG